MEMYWAALALQGVVFLVWVVLAFRWLFAMRREAVERSGRTLPGIGAQWQAFRAGLTDPRHRATRLPLLIATLVLLALSGLSALLLLN